MGISYENLRDKGNRIVFESQESFVIERNCQNITKRRHKIVKEKYLQTESIHNRPKEQQSEHKIPVQREGNTNNCCKRKEAKYSKSRLNDYADIKSDSWERGCKVKSEESRKRCSRRQSSNTIEEEISAKVSLASNVNLENTETKLFQKQLHDTSRRLHRVEKAINREIAKLKQQKSFLEMETKREREEVLAQKSSPTWADNFAMNTQISSLHNEPEVTEKHYSQQHTCACCSPRYGTNKDLAMRPKTRTIASQMVKAFSDDTDTGASGDHNTENKIRQTDNETEKDVNTKLMADDNKPIVNCCYDWPIYGAVNGFRNYNASCQHYDNGTACDHRSHQTSGETPGREYTYCCDKYCYDTSPHNAGNKGCASAQKHYANCSLFDEGKSRNKTTHARQGSDLNTEHFYCRRRDRSAPKMSSKSKSPQKNTTDSGVFNKYEMNLKSQVNKQISLKKENRAEEYMLHRNKEYAEKRRRTSNERTKRNEESTRKKMMEYQENENPSKCVNILDDFDINTDNQKDKAETGKDNMDHRASSTGTYKVKSHKNVGEITLKKLNPEMVPSTKSQQVYHATNATGGSLNFHAETFQESQYSLETLSMLKRMIIKEYKPIKATTKNFANEKLSVFTKTESSKKTQRSSVINEKSLKYKEYVKKYQTEYHAREKENIKDHDDTYEEQLNAYGAAAPTGWDDYGQPDAGNETEYEMIYKRKENDKKRGHMADAFRTEEEQEGKYAYTPAENRKEMGGLNHKGDFSPYKRPDERETLEHFKHKSDNDDGATNDQESSYDFSTTRILKEERVRKYKENGEILDIYKKDQSRESYKGRVSRTTAKSEISRIKDKSPNYETKSPQGVPMTKAQNQAVTTDDELPEIFRMTNKSPSYETNSRRGVTMTKVQPHALPTDDELREISRIKDKSDYPKSPHSQGVPMTKAQTHAIPTYDELPEISRMQNKSPYYEIKSPQGVPMTKALTTDGEVPEISRMTNKSPYYETKSPQGLPMSKAQNHALTTDDELPEISRIKDKFAYPKSPHSVPMAKAETYTLTTDDELIRKSPTGGPTNSKHNKEEHNLYQKISSDGKKNKDHNDSKNRRHNYSTIPKEIQKCQPHVTHSERERQMDGAFNDKYKVGQPVSEQYHLAYSGSNENASTYKEKEKKDSNHNTSTYEENTYKISGGNDSTKYRKPSFDSPQSESQLKEEEEKTSSTSYEEFKLDMNDELEFELDKCSSSKTQKENRELKKESRGHTKKLNESTQTLQDLLNFTESKVELITEKPNTLEFMKGLRDIMSSYESGTLEDEELKELTCELITKFNSCKCSTTGGNSRLSDDKSTNIQADKEAVEKQNPGEVETTSDLTTKITERHAMNCNEVKQEDLKIPVVFNKGNDTILDDRKVNGDCLQKVTDAKEAEEENLKQSDSFKAQENLYKTPTDYIYFNPQVETEMKQTHSTLTDMKEQYASSEADYQGYQECLENVNGLVGPPKKDHNGLTKEKLVSENQYETQFQQDRADGLQIQYTFTPSPSETCGVPPDIASPCNETHSDRVDVLKMQYTPSPAYQVNDSVGPPPKDHNGLSKENVVSENQYETQFESYGVQQDRGNLEDVLKMQYTPSSSPSKVSYNNRSEYFDTETCRVPHDISSHCNETQFEQDRVDGLQMQYAPSPSSSKVSYNNHRKYFESETCGVPRNISSVLPLRGILKTNRSSNCLVGDGNRQVPVVNESEVFETISVVSVGREEGSGMQRGHSATSCMAEQGKLTQHSEENLSTVTTIDWNQQPLRNTSTYNLRGNIFSNSSPASHKSQSMQNEIQSSHDCNLRQIQQLNTTNPTNTLLNKLPPFTNCPCMLGTYLKIVGIYLKGKDQRFHRRFTNCC